MWPMLWTTTTSPSTTEAILIICFHRYARISIEVENGNFDYFFAIKPLGEHLLTFLTLS
jgi:hypothetical protein